jgi:hypothetical protein
MRPDLFANLDALWAARLQCDTTTLHNQNTNILIDPNRVGAEVWLRDKTCVMLAGPELARALQASVGTRNPVVAFEPSRLREAIATFGLPLHSSEAVLVFANSLPHLNTVTWIPLPTDGAALAAAVDRVRPMSIPMLAIPHRERSARRVAEASGFILYASVIYIGERPEWERLVIA